MTPLTVAPVLLVILWCCGRTSGAERLDLIRARLLNMLNLRQSVPSYKRNTRVDLRGHKLFASDPTLECCPTYTLLTARKTGINPWGLLLELVEHDEPQTFYETYCLHQIKDRSCQFLDPKYSKDSRCVQQYTYMYAVGRTYGNDEEQFRQDRIRVPTGCKCKLINKDLMSNGYSSNSVL